MPFAWEDWSWDKERVLDQGIRAEDLMIEQKRREQKGLEKKKIQWGRKKIQDFWCLERKENNISKGKERRGYF